MSDAGTYAQVPAGQEAPDRYQQYVDSLQPVWLAGENRREQNRVNLIQDLASGRVGSRIMSGSFYTNPYAPTPYAPQPAETAAVVAAKYGYAAAFLDHPEVGPILQRAAAGGWGEAELYGAISQTNWWRSSSDNERSWEMLVNEDPATASRVAGEIAAKIQNKARTLGIPLSTGQIGDLARTVAKYGWNDEQIVDRLISQASWAGLTAGDLTARRDEVKALAADYLVSLDDSTAQQYAARIASGEMTMEGVRSTLQRQAQTRYAWMSDVIEQGVSPSMYLAPIRNDIANELEIAVEEVDLMKPEWLGMIEVVDDKTGRTRAATRREATLAARRDPRWKDTSNAQSAAARAIQFVQTAMGRRPI